MSFDADTNRAVVTALGSVYVNGERISTTEVAIINPATGLQLGTTLTLFDEVRSGSQVSGDGSIVVTSTGTKLAVLSTADGRQLGNTITRGPLEGGGERRRRPRGVPDRAEQHLRMGSDPGGDPEDHLNQRSVCCPGNNPRC